MGCPSQDCLLSWLGERSSEALDKNLRSKNYQPTQALLDFDLKKHRMSMNVNIVIDDPEELERVRQKEMDITKARSGVESLHMELCGLMWPHL